MNRTKITIAAAIFVMPLHAMSASARSLPDVTLIVCGSSAPLADVANSVVDLSSPVSVAAIRNATVTISSDGRSFSTAKGGRRSIDSAFAQSVEPAACQTTLANGRKILPGGEIPGASILALKAVLNFRKEHPWPGPGTGVDSNDPTTAVFLQTRGSFVIISFVASPAHVSGCTGQESYRFDTKTLEVLAFDDCIEPHQAILPRIRQLPD